MISKRPNSIRNWKNRKQLVDLKGHTPLFQYSAGIPQSLQGLKFTSTKILMLQEITPNLNLGNSFILRREFKTFLCNLSERSVGGTASVQSMGISFGRVIQSLLSAFWGGWFLSWFSETHEVQTRLKHCFSGAFSLKKDEHKKYSYIYVNTCIHEKVSAIALIEDKSFD